MTMPEKFPIFDLYHSRNDPHSCFRVVLPEDGVGPRAGVYVLYSPTTGQPHRLSLTDWNSRYYAVGGGNIIMLPEVFQERKCWVRVSVPWEEMLPLSAEEVYQTMERKAAAAQRAQLVLRLSKDQRYVEGHRLPTTPWRGRENMLEAHDLLTLDEVCRAAFGNNELDFYVPRSLRRRVLTMMFHTPTHYVNTGDVLLFKPSMIKLLKSASYFGGGAEEL